MVKKEQKNITKILMGLYLLILTWLIIFKMQVDISEFIKLQYRNINLIPFRGSMITNEKINLKEIILNVIVFVPFGVYISILKEKWNFWKKSVSAFFISLSYETVQYIFAVGASDITDLIGNTIGGMLGIMLFWLLSKVLKENTIKVINILSIAGIIFAICLFVIIYAANF